MAMEVLTIPSDIRILYVTAISFPTGVGGAFRDLAALLPAGDNRIRYGISYPDRDGKIIYRAGVEEKYDGEADNLDCEVFTAYAGQYISEKLIDWKQDESSVGKAFQHLLKDPRIDLNGACLEKYINDKDVICMVRLDTSLA